MLRYLLLPLCALLLFGCEQKTDKPLVVTETPVVQVQPQPEVTQKSLILLKDPLNAELFETAAEAIPTWRQYAAAKPTLVLLSQNPFLMPVPERGKKDALQLTHNGNLNDFKAKATAFVSDPIILPNMALSAALNAGFFSEIIWVLPVTDTEKILSLEVFRKQLVESGIATQVEADSFVSNGKGFSGTLRQITLTAVPFHALGPVNGPTLLHLDLSFLKALYINEIKTPIHALTYKTLAKLRETKMSVFAMTLSHSHQHGDISLEVRFVGNLIKRLLKTPDYLDLPLSKQDAQHQQALYLANFFQKDKILELYMSMEETAPQDASIKYALYQITSQFKQGDKALDYLAQAADLDSAYALEYFQLAPMALEKGHPLEALHMLELSREHFPHNPFIPLQMTELLVNLGKKDIAISELEKLSQLPWSDLYHNGIKEKLRTDTESMRTPKTKIPTVPDKRKMKSTQ